MSSYVREASPAALDAVSKIVGAAGLVQNFAVLEGDFTTSPNAYAIMVRRQRFIVYDKRLFFWKDGRPGWNEITILAHEIGHHLNGHTLDGKGSEPATELDADRFAGFAVSRLGGSLENALSVFRSFPEAGSKTHPPRAQRLAAVEAGWRDSESRKKQEKIVCSTNWIDGPFELRGKICRMAKVCAGKTVVYRLACAQRSGPWVWQK